MQYLVNRGIKGKVDVKVDVPKAAFETAYDQIVINFGKKTNIAGFRPGMAPAEVVISHVGANKILNETASSLVSKHLSEIFEKEKFFPIDSPKIAIGSLAAAAPFSFTASFTQKPDVKVGDWKSIKISKVMAKEVRDEDVNESVKNIYDAWVKQRALKETDGTEKVNETAEGGKFIYDARGNKIPVRSKEEVKKEPSETKIDDNFARAIGARDLGHLRELVRKDLETIVADQVEVKLEEELFKKLSEISAVEVPDILVEDELNRILVRLNSQLEQQKKDLDTFLKEEKTTIDELKNKWREQAEKNVKVTLVMDEIGRAEKVTVSKEEIEVAMKGVNDTNVSAEQRSDLERYLALSIFQAKTLEIIKRAAVVESLTPKS